MIPAAARKYFDELRLLAATGIDPRLNDRSIDRLSDEFEALYDRGEAIELVDEELAIMGSEAPIADRVSRIYDRAVARMAAHGDAKRGGRLQ
jgi:hypothetical protein